MNNHVMVALFSFIYNLILVGGTAYLVAIHDWSPWWFLLTVACMVTIVKTKE
jgi:hypothetical protein